jgi:Fe-S cluster biogenesis protein NfuA
MQKKEEIRIKFRNVHKIVFPYLQQDGGDIEFINYEEDTHTLVVAFLGNCKDCPLSIMTLRAGIEKLVLKEIPEVRRVETQ